MTTTEEHLTECAHPVAGEVALPEYAVTVAECGNPRSVIEELTEWLHEQTPPQIPTEPEPAEDEPVGELEPTEGEESDETSEVEQ